MAGTGSVDGEGFEAEFVCTSPAAPEYTTDACEGDGVLITDGGSVSFAAAELEPSQDCHWTVVCTGAGLVPQLTFSSFDTEAHFDFVYVYDSASPRGQAVEMHGTEIPLPLWATGSAGHMRYMSDWSVNGEGFDATVTCVEGVVEDGVVYTSAFESDQEDHESACDGGVVVGDGDAVGLPEGYSPSAQCSWLITCPLAPVVLTFVEMDIGSMPFGSRTTRRKDMDDIFVQILKVLFKKKVDVFTDTVRNNPLAFNKKLSSFKLQESHALPWGRSRSASFQNFLRSFFAPFPPTRPLAETLARDEALDK